MQRMGDEPGIALIYGNPGVLNQRAGDAEQAVEFYQRALTILERIGDKHNAARYYNNLGLLYYDQGLLAQARVHLQKAQTLFEMVGDEQHVWKVQQELQRCG
jgi:tetratricopeptide (TPR) repeat protein